MAGSIRTTSPRVNYFDAQLDDGSSLEIVFHAGDPLAAQRPVEPFVTVRLDRPGAAPVSFESHSPIARFNVGADRCRFLIGDNHVHVAPTHPGGTR